MTQLAIRTRTTVAGPVVELVGELDYVTCARFRGALPALSLEPGQQLVVDLAGIALCDSSGISALIAARNHTRAADATIALTAVPAALARTLSLVGLSQIFPTYPTPQAAEAAWTASSV
ncbi:STAS domain-containing protein [Streptomyces sp. NPDC055060]